MKSIERSHYLSCTDDAMSKYVWLLDNYNYLQNQHMYGSVYLLKMFTIFIGAELGGAAGARAPPLLHNPRKFIV